MRPNLIFLLRFGFPHLCQQGRERRVAWLHIRHVETRTRDPRASAPLMGVWQDVLVEGST